MGIFALKFYLYTSEFREIKIKGLQKALGYVIMGYKSFIREGVFMSVMRSKNGKELMVDCGCGCNEGVKIKVNTEDADMYFLVTYTNGNFYRDQNESIFGVIKKKLKKIYAILANKDYCYSEICMTKEDFLEFKEFVNNVE